MKRRIILAGGRGFLGQVLREHFLNADLLARAPN